MRKHLEEEKPLGQPTISNPASRAITKGLNAQLLAFSYGPMIAAALTLAKSCGGPDAFAQIPYR